MEAIAEAPINIATAATTVDPGDDEEAAFYEEHRAYMEQVLNHPGGQFLLRPRAGGGVGLLNQGATCYMNSLLQALFHTPEFRLAVYRWRSDPRTGCADELSIPLQLQKLFVELQVSPASAVSTLALTKAFGFTESDARDRQDLQELCRVLLDALERAAPGLAKEIDRIFGGTTRCRIQSFEPSDGKLPESWREEKFFDLQVPIRGCSTLEQAIKKLTEPEVLEGDNCWFCEDVGRKVEAWKGVEFLSLPSVLCLQLMRFFFDYATMQQQKVTDKLAIPLVLDLGFLPGLSGATPAVYELAAICFHDGSDTDTGHYHAFIKIYDSGSIWCDVNDATVRKIGIEELGTKVANGKQRVLNSTQAYFLMYRKASSSDDIPQITEADLPDTLKEEALTARSRLEDLQRAFALRRKLVEVQVFAPAVARLALCKRLAVQIRQVLAGTMAKDRTEASYARATQQLTDDWLSNLPDIEPSSECTHVVMCVRETMPVAQARQRAFTKFFSQRRKGSQPEDWISTVHRLGFSKCRLRVFDPMTGSIGAPVSEDEEQNTVGAVLGLSVCSPSARSQCLVFEVSHEEHGFEEWCEDFYSMLVCRWRSPYNVANFSQDDLVMLRLPPRENLNSSTKDRTPLVGAVREAAARVWQEDSSRMTLVVGTGPTTGLVLTDNSASLEKSGVAPGDLLWADFAPANGGACGALEVFRRIRQHSIISVNHPDGTFYSNVFVPRVAVVRDVKERIAKAWSLDADGLHFRLQRNAPQVTNETATLNSIGMGASGCLFVGHGPPHGEGEFELQVALYVASKDTYSVLQDAFLHTVQGYETVEATKRNLIEPLLHWSRQEAEAEGNGVLKGECLSPKRLRLRDGRSGAQRFAVLRDDALLKSAMSSLHDGHKLVVQVLDKDEALLEQDLLVEVLCWRPLDGHLQGPVELVVDRGQTLGEFRSQLTKRFYDALVRRGEEVNNDIPTASEEEEDMLEIVCLPYSEAPTTVTTCASLQWAESVLSSNDAALVATPLSRFKEVYDGVVLVLRSALDAWQDQLARASAPALKTSGLTIKVFPNGRPVVDQLKD